MSTAGVLDHTLQVVLKNMQYLVMQSFNMLVAFNKLLIT